MKVEVSIRPGYTFRVYDDASSVEDAKQQFLDEIKDNLGTEHLRASVEEDEDCEGAKA
jgi:hypothetical protein